LSSKLGLLSVHFVCGLLNKTRALYEMKFGIFSLGNCIEMTVYPKGIKVRDKNYRILK
jgi:hypothetical protein